jgi:hypothetical protein
MNGYCQIERSGDNGCMWIPTWLLWLGIGIFLSRRIGVYVRLAEFPEREVRQIVRKQATEDALYARPLSLSLHAMRET